MAALLPQKCNRLHEESAFNGLQRTCIKQLQVLSERRLARRRSKVGSPPHSASAETGEEAVAESVLLSPATSGGSGCEGVADDHGLHSFLTRWLQGAEAEADPSGALSFDELMAAAALSSEEGQQGAAGGDTEALRLTIKLPAAPHMVPWGAFGARPAVAQAARAAVGAGDESTALVVTGSIRPGCTLLTLDVLLPQHAAGEEGSAECALRALMEQEGPFGSFLRRCSAQVQLGAQRAGGVVYIARGGGGGGGGGEGGSGWVWLEAPAAALSDQPLPLTLPAGAPGWEPLRARVHGQYAQVQRSAGGAGRPARFTLPALHCVGAAFVEVHQPCDRADAQQAQGAAVRDAAPVLLCDDARVCAEVNASDEEAASSRGSLGQRVRLRTAALALAHALRRPAAAAGTAEVQASCAAAVAGCAAALRAGWSHSFAVAAPRLAAWAPFQPSPPRLPGGAALLHVAAQHGSAAAVASLLALRRPDVFGSPAQRARGDLADGDTPLHAASRRGDTALLMALLGRDCGGGGGDPDGSADALSAFFFAVNARGDSPAAVWRGPPAALHAMCAEMHAGRACAQAACLSSVPGDLDSTLQLLIEASTVPLSAAQRAQLAVARTLVVAGAAALPVPFCVWRTRQLTSTAVSCSLMQAAFHITQLMHTRATWSAALLPPADEQGVVRLAFAFGSAFDRGTRGYALSSNTGYISASWYTFGMPAFRPLFASSLPLQLLATAALLLPAATAAAGWPRSRRLFAEWLNPLMALQHFAHMLFATYTCGQTLQALTGNVHVVWPLLLAIFISACTLLGGFGWAIPPRVCLPLLAVRAALPLACLAGYPVWLDTGAQGVVMQVSACVLAAALSLRREAWLRATYQAEQGVIAKGTFPGQLPALPDFRPLATAMTALGAVNIATRIASERDWYQ